MVELNLATVSFILAGVAFLIILLAGLRKRILMRVGFRNVVRRKTQVILAVAGLTVATSIISGALVISDSFDATVLAIVLRGTDHVDEVVYLQDEAGLRSYFDYSVYERLHANLSTMENVDAVAPRIHLPAAVSDERTDLVQPSTTLIAFDPALDMGSFTLLNGSSVDGTALQEDEVYVNEALASELDAKGGDVVQVFVNGQSLDMRVRDVVQDIGRGGWATTDGIFLRLSAVQQALNVSGQINFITVSNIGGVADGHEATDGALEDLNAVLGEGHPFVIEAIKRDAIDLFTDLMDQLSQLFTLMSAFTVVAGILLILNIFSMVAEERKTEMGMARALGMRRSHLVQAFIFEGFIYSLASAVLGAFAGLGVATVIMEAFRQIFTFFARDLQIVFELGSLMTAFSLGLLLTLVTIALASWRISKLNIVRAIRDLPEPLQKGATWLELLAAATLAGGGAFGLYYSLVESNEMLYIVGAPLIALGLGLAAVHRLGPRLPLTIAGAFTIAWILMPFRFIGEVEPNIENFIIAGILLVAGGVLTIMANSAFILRLGPKITKDRKALPVIKAAIAYPLAKKFRTGVILAMFALIMFTITVMSMVMAMTGSTVDVFGRMESGGYQVIGRTSPFAILDDFDERLNESGLAESIEFREELLQARVLVSGPRLGEMNYPLVGVSQDFADRNEFSFHRMAEGYETSRDVWEALTADPSLAVVDRSAQPVDFGPATDFRAEVGDVLRLENVIGEQKDVTVIAILDARFVPGIFVAGEGVEEFGFIDKPTLFYFKITEGEDESTLSKSLEREFVDYGLQTTVIMDEVRDAMEVTLNVMQLIQAFLALGLAVGISGLGVLAVRNVVERKAMIGTLRALGFRKEMVLKAFLIELSFVAVLGILLGLVLGIALSYNLYSSMDLFRDAEFIIPWPNLLFILVFSFVASVLATLSPSLRASKMPPAEALRQVL